MFLYFTNCFIFCITILLDYYPKIKLKDNIYFNNHKYIGYLIMSNNNYCQPPLQFESNNQRNNNEFIYMSNTTNLTYSDGNDSTKPAIYMGDGWCTFPDLDNFDSEILLKAFTLKVKIIIK